jgi:hypothetical protein
MVLYRREHAAPTELRQFYWGRGCYRHVAPTELGPFRRGWCLGSPEFKARMLEQPWGVLRGAPVQKSLSWHQIESQ